MKTFILLYMILVSISSAGSIKPIKHEFFTKGYRIMPQVKIKDDTGIAQARVYFKRDTVQDYQVYVQMLCLQKSCSAELPLTSIHLKKLNYVIVYQNNAGKVYRSKTVTMEKRDMLELPSWQTLNLKELQIYSEYAKAPRFINGFKDSFTITKAQQDEVIGVKAGLYPMELISPEASVDCAPCDKKKGKKE